MIPVPASSTRSNFSDSPDDLPGLEGGLDGPKSIVLTPEQKDALGLADCLPGDKYIITLTAGDGGDPEAGGGQSFDVTSTVPDESEGEEDLLSDELDDGPIEPEEESLGYRRKKKPVREGLPSTDKLREYR